jgi:hypothetical protein
MATTLKYTLKQFNDVSYGGFNFKIPKDTFDTINYLCIQVGSPCIASDVFTTSAPVNDNSNGFSSSSVINKNIKKKRGNKGTEISSDEWENIRTFQITKIEQKTGIASEIDQLRLFLNKLTDKTFLDLREKIIDKINNICSQITEQNDIIKVGQMLYDMSSSNKFYSKIFADMFAELATMYSWLKDVFNEKYNSIMEQYNNIRYVDFEKDYDGFCDMNKENEKRRAITTFYLNLAINGFIEKEFIVKILRDILTSILNMINSPDKKNEIDELTEIVGVLFNKDIIEEVNRNADNKEEFYVLNKTIIENINNLAQQKAKDYPSLSNKAIFKYMDLVEM